MSLNCDAKKEEENNKNTISFKNMYKTGSEFKD
jgi:hypothetical protein